MDSQLPSIHSQPVQSFRLTNALTTILHLFPSRAVLLLPYSTCSILASKHLFIPGIPREGKPRKPGRHSVPLSSTTGSKGD
ncbi:hypothetical protein E2C01_068300 [Portunus trituberculatus]|uniref:Uncharacterized protein n=1 Tax=Portunus trituberculatus TaxID=210409 RepID=A0A5B7HXI5_PORTR|nr:hypothetical protein [Portunus trituberculatus]